MYNLHCGYAPSEIKFLAAVFSIPSNMRHYRTMTLVKPRTLSCTTFIFNFAMLYSKWRKD